MTTKKLTVEDINAMFEEKSPNELSDTQIRKHHGGFLAGQALKNRKLPDETRLKIRAKRALQTNIGRYVHTPEIIAKREAKKAATLALRPKKVVPPKVKKSRPPMPDHVKAKLQEAVKSEEYSLMMSLLKKGVKHTKLVADGTRAPMSEEQRELRRQANLGGVKPKTMCVHCKKMVANNMLHRYHMDNCKLKV